MDITVIPGDSICKLRHYKGFMQKEVADKIGKTQQAYSKLEKKRFLKPKTVKKIIIALGCTEEEFEKIVGCPLPGYPESSAKRSSDV